MSTRTTSRPRDCAASIASKATAAGSPPRAAPTKSAPARSAHTSSCSSAAARNVSAAATITSWSCSRSRCASFPIVVVLPVPFTPTKRRTLGCSPTSSVPGSPMSASISSASAPSSPSLRSSRASSRRTSSAVVGTPTSAKISASSSRSQASSSPGSKAAAASCPDQRAAALAERVAQAREESGPLFLAPPGRPPRRAALPSSAPSLDAGLVRYEIERRELRLVRLALGVVGEQRRRPPARPATSA